jgi:hypothetical protein
MLDFRRHPLAKHYRRMTEAEFTGLKDSIKTIGQRNAGTLLDGKILDGWERYIACRELGLEMRFDNFCDLVELRKVPNDPVAFLESQNLHRRHLSDVELSTLNDDSGMSSGKHNKGESEALDGEHNNQIRQEEVVT